MFREMRPLGLEEGMGILEEGFSRARRILEGDPDAGFTTEEFIKLYECAYRMCTQRPDYACHVYNRYKSSLEQCVTTMVLPSLMDKNGEILLRELLNLWSNYQSMVRWLSNVLQYIDRFYIYRASVPSLKELAVSCFCNLVSVLNGKIRDAVIYLIDRERDGEQVDVLLLKNTMSFILNANKDIQIEQAILERTCAFYSQKVSEWILEYSISDYFLKVEECLKRENERLSQYIFCELNRGKLLQVVRDQMMSVCEQLNGQLALQNYVAMNQELVSRCANLTLGNGNLGDVSCTDMES